MWKYLKENNLSPYQGFKYELNKEYIFNDYDRNENHESGRGGNVATLQWCLKDNNQADIFMEVEFHIKDIVAIPYTTDGKMRVRKFKTLRIINREKAIKLLNDKMNKEA
jgi:hypothetical protein